MQIGRPTPDHAKCVADAGALLPLADSEADERGGDDLHGKACRALKGIMAKLTHLPALDTMVHRNLPEGVMKVVLEQLGKVQWSMNLFTTSTDAMLQWSAPFALQHRIMYDTISTLYTIGTGHVLIYASRRRWRALR